MTVHSRPDGGWCFLRADGREFASDRAGVRSDHHHSNITASTRWRGERIDYDHTA